LAILAKISRKLVQEREGVYVLNENADGEDTYLEMYVKDQG
jgi:hypothetical protein